MGAGRERELDELLDFAERLGTNVETTENSILRLRTLSYLVLMGMAVAVISFAIVINSSESSAFALSTMQVTILSLGAAGLGIGLVEALALAGPKRRLRGAVGALNETVDILREVADTIAIEEEWSALEKAAFRVRTSQFGIRETWGRSSPPHKPESEA